MSECRAGYHTCICKPRACELQEAVDNAFWSLLAGLHDIDEGREDLTHEDVIKSAMKILSTQQACVG